MFSVSNLNCLIDLHLHLDGAISLASARKLAALRNISLPESDSELSRLMRVPEGCRDLEEYLECFELPLRLLQTPEAITMAMETLLAELHESGVIYAEIRFAPQLHLQLGYTQEEAVEAAVCAQSPIPFGVILCGVRDLGNDAQNEETARLAVKFHGRGVYAFDMACSEIIRPNRDYAGLLGRVLAAGVPVTVHAGEACGPENMTAMLDLGVPRIGHGIHAPESEAMMDRLAAQGTTLELCPTSNLCTAVFEEIGQYPVRAFLDRGIRVTVNTDGPTVAGTDIRREFDILLNAGLITPSDVRLLLMNAAGAAFAPETIRQTLKQRIAADFEESGL